MDNPSTKKLRGSIYLKASDQTHDIAQAIAKFTTAVVDGLPGYAMLAVRTPDGSPLCWWFDPSDKKSIDTMSLRAAERNLKGYGVHLALATRQEKQDRHHPGKEEDCLQTRFLWLDIDESDPAIADWLLAFAMKPTIVVRSGGGHHAYWRLNTPIPANNRLKRILRGLARAFRVDGDEAVTSPKSMMRVPGTLNTKPTRQTLAEVVYWGDESYPVDDFKKLEVHDVADMPRIVKPQVAIEGKKERLTAEDIVAKLGGGKKIDASRWLCRCPNPSHGKGKGDKGPSLQVTKTNDRTLLKCFGHCDTDAVLTAMHLTMADLFLEDSRPATPLEARAMALQRKKRSKS